LNRPSPSPTNSSYYGTHCELAKRGHNRDGLKLPAVEYGLLPDGGPSGAPLFSRENLAEITHPNFPGERLVLCFNPLLSAESPVWGDVPRNRNANLAGGNASAPLK